MRIYLKTYVLSLAKKSEEGVSSLVPGHLRNIEREMEKGLLTADQVMSALKDDKYLRPALGDGDWKMIEREVRKMIK
jgi:hypothetical protein